jgi:electron transport complex protein RnfC
MNNFSNLAKTFYGGIHPKTSGKELSCNEKLVIPPILDTYYIPLVQNAGAAPTVLIKKGDYVKKYQLIAQASSFVSANIHAPTSGTIIDIKPMVNSLGLLVSTAILESDKLDVAELPFSPIANWQDADAKELLTRVGDAGIVGMGGASFPARVKLSPPPEKNIDTLILNGAECEPYLTADHRLMLEFPEKVLSGAAISAKILGVNNIFIGIEINKVDAIKSLTTLADKYNVKIVPLKVSYPQGSEKQLIEVITNRQIPSGKLPMDVGCVVQNVGTAAAIADAVINNIPSIERIVTVTGSCIVKPGNYLLRIGTPVLKAIEFAGGVKAEPTKLIFGGPMMGFAQKTFEANVTKNTSGILLLNDKEALTYESGSCIRCGKCLAACPIRIQPCLLATAIESNRIDLAAINHVMDCIECGACAYTCPAHRPLVQHIRRAKAQLRRQK